MRELQAAVLNEVQRLGASYADVRIVTTRTQSIGTKNGEVEVVTSGDECGFGVRVLFGGAWGFACSNRLDIEEAVKVARTAVRIAQASATALTHPVRLTGVARAEAVYANEYETDPFSVPIETKIDLLLSVDRLLRADKKIAVARAKDRNRT